MIRRRAARPAIAVRSRTTSALLRNRPQPTASGHTGGSGLGSPSDAPSALSGPAPLKLTRVVIRKRLPPFWRGVDDGLADGSPERLRLWRLVCTALRIPSKQVGDRLMVPVLYETLARKHLHEVAREGRIPPAPPPPARNNAHLALLTLALLLVWFGITRQWWLDWPPLSPENWNTLGALDVRQVMQGQWYRAFTALTLHSNSEHLFSNILFGAPFFVLLCRQVGVGPGAALAVVSGALGNVGNSFYRLHWHSPGFVSLGFSTALFGIVGALSGIMAAREILHLLPVLRAGHDNAPRQLFLGLRRALVLLAAGVAVLAMLGSDPSARTDYAAHIFGLLAGILCGLGYACLPRLARNTENVLGPGAFLLLAGAWILAFNRN